MRFILAAAVLALVSGCLGDNGEKPEPKPDDGIEIIVAEAETPDPAAEMRDSKTRRVIDGEDLGGAGPVIAPDPLAAAPPKISRGPKQPEHYLFCYGGDGIDRQTGRPWCPAYVLDKPKILGWANKNGLTCSEANAANARYAVVQFIDWNRDKPARNLQFSPPDPPLFPTYVIVNQQGEECWHRVGSLPPDELEFIWQLIESD